MWTGNRQDVETRNEVGFDISDVAIVDLETCQCNVLPMCIGA